MRRELRRNVSRPARIDLGNGRILPCRIGDISRNGALLVIPDSEWLPKEFILIDTFAGTERWVRIAWTSPNKAGVKYLDSGPRERSKGFGKRTGD